MVSCMNKENNVFKDGIGVKGLRFKLHGNHGYHGFVVWVGEMGVW